MEKLIGFVIEYKRGDGIDTDAACVTCIQKPEIARLYAGDKFFPCFDEHANPEETCHLCDKEWK